MKGIFQEGRSKGERDFTKYAEIRNRHRHKERKKAIKKERKKTRRLEFEKFDLRNAKDKQTTTKREKERMSNLKLGIVHHKRPLKTQCNAFSQYHLKHN